jgi:2-methylisocitrate lyase-like PEP mutase family enzyme
MINAAGLRVAAERLRALHHGDRPLLLPNAWDSASARAVEAAGFDAVATSSSAVAAALGYADQQGTPVDEMFAVVSRIARVVSVPVTADVEAGYGLAADELIERLLAAGAVGCNLEDSDPATGGLIGIAAQARWLGEVRGAADRQGVPVVINARVDVHLRQVGPPEGRLDDALRRGSAYLAAGADCVFPIIVSDEPTIRALVNEVGGPINVISGPDPLPLERLAELGVARISLGGGMHRLVMAALEEALARIASTLGRD